MGLRGVIRDLLSIYLGFRIIQMSFGAPFSGDVAIAGLILFFLAIWFILERAGLVPRLG